MTALRLKDSSVDSPLHAVVGKCTPQNAVSHVGILEGARFVSAGDKVPVFHMANAIALLELPGTMDAHALGWLVDMADEEHKSVSGWLQRIKTSSVKIDYLAFPAFETLRDKANGRTIGRKFSCAGFVQCCFEEALQVSLVVSLEHLPNVDRNLLEEVWDARIVARGVRYGLRGAGPWKVLLPSYIFHALNKTRTELPHNPSAAEPNFPPSP